MSPAPIDERVAEGTRQLVRYAKRRLLDNFEQLEELLATDEIRDLAHLFAVKRGTGQQRALIRLRKHIDAHGRYQGSEFKPRPAAVWAILKPVLFSDDLHSTSPVAAGVEVQLLAVHANGHHIAPWTLTCSFHSLCRLLQRDPSADIAGAIFDAHKGVLQAGLHRLDAPTRCLLPAGQGGFVSIRDGERVVSTTWVSHDMLYPDQVKMLEVFSTRIGARPERFKSATWNPRNVGYCV